MKSKCSFIFKASTALVLALIMLFGTVATSVAAAVKNEPAAVEAESDSVGTPFRDADGTTKIVIYYDDTNSKLSELNGFEDMYFVIAGEDYYRGYKMTDLQEDNLYVAAINESYDDAKMFYVIAVDKDWTGKTSEEVGAPFDKNVKKQPGVIGSTDTYSDEFVFKTTNADMGHAYKLNTTEEAPKTIEVNDIGVCPQPVVIPDADADAEPVETVGADYFLNVIDGMKSDAPVLLDQVDEAPAEVKEDAAPAEDVADEQIVRDDKDADLADTGASAGTWKVTFKANMGSGDYNTGTTYYTMTRSTKNTNRYYYVATGLSTNSSYGFFLQYNSSNYWKANATISLGGHTELYDYGNSNFGNSSHRVTFTTGSATSYVFMFDISTNEVFVNSVTPGVEFTYDIASGHDSNFDLDKKVSMTYSNYLYTCDIASMSAAKYYLFCKVGSNYYRGTSTLTTSAPASLWDYGTSNYGNSGDKVNFTPSSAGKYRFTYDVRDATVSVVKVYDITYNKNNGTGTAPANQTVTAGSSVTIGTNSLTRTGYTASGWNTNSGGTGTDYANGASYTANANLTLYAKWTEKTSTFTVQAGSNGTITKSGTTSGVASYVTVSAVTPSSGYDFVGWQITGADASHVRIKNSSGTQVFNGTTWTSEANQYLTAIRVYSDGSSASMTATVTAVFAKKHYLTLYNTTVFDRGHWIVQGSPPQTVTVTHASGAVTTYTYAAGTKAQRGEDQTTSGSAGTSNTKTSGTYYEGNKLTIYEGDTIELHYSALASSDIISGVFYNNAIRYTTELEDDNLFLHRNYNAEGYGSGTDEDPYKNGASDENPPDDDWEYKYNANYSDDTDGHALYANAKYYYDDVRTTIEENASNYCASVNQDTHVVSWTAGDRDYLNVDIELSNKREIHFSDYVNTVINEVHTDNYYAVGETISPGTAADTSLSIKAAGNANQTNTITKANIKFYYCNNMGEYINPDTGRKVSKENRVELRDPDNTLSVNGSAASIANSGATASSSFYYIGGTMPECDVLVDLDLVTTYSLTMKSKVLSDTNSPAMTAFIQVANLQLGSASKTKSTSYTTSTTVGPSSCEAGKNITLKASNITSGYMFVGWYLDNGSGAPDTSKPALSTSATFSYKPTSNATIWAVGTRDLYITGAKELFEGDTSDYVKHHRMTFDPSLGTGGVYYYEITETVFAAASRQFTRSDFYTGNDTHKYWTNNTYSGNSQFQLRDNGTDNDNTRTIWTNITSFSDDNTDVEFGKVYFPTGTYDEKQYDGIGYIKFTESAKPGYSTPLRIYYDPNGSGTGSGKLYVKATPVYAHIYLSNGYKGLDVSKTGTPNDVYISVNGGTSRRNNIKSESSYTANLKFIGNGWDPSNEGHVSDVSVSARNATLTLKKTTSSANYKVSNFLVYNITKNTVKAYPATATGTTNEYQCNTIKTSDADVLYIMPILEYIGSSKKMTVVVDSSSLDYKQWGRLVACYAWNGSGDNNGPYPGQPMVPSDDGNSWKATFECSSLTGITLSNYVNDVAGTTFLDTSGTLGTVSDHSSGTASGGRINVYNHITSDDPTYDRTNFKAQTYDYREPIAYYNNQPAGATNTVLTFSLKSGNSKLLSWRDSELRDLNILTYKQEHPTWSDITFEYLTDSSGSKYADLNGFALPEKPTASFYIAAKAMVIYDDNVMTRVFSTGKYSNSNTIDAAANPDANYKDYKGYSSNDLDMNFAVQWYIYDASGKFITSCLSAGFADKNATHQDMSVVTQRLLDLGYAVEGRSVKICYDIPRYCFTNDNSQPSSGANFDVYRFTGQWYMDNEYKKANVYAKVGIMTDNGEEIAESSSAPYGSASVSVNNSLCTIAGYSGTDTTDEGVDYGYTTVIDGDKGAITLTASETNFIGWYHYNSDKKLELDTKERIFRPSYSADSTYIAMYEAKVNYSYPYVGREGGTKYYNVGSDTHLNETEIAAGNKVATDSTHTSEAGSKSPGSAGIGIFKKTVTFTTPVTTSMLSNPNEYQLIVNNCTITNATYQITAKYRNASGDLVDYVTPAKEYNQVVDLTTLNSGNSLIQWTGHKFIGWYEYVNSSTVGQLLSTQANYGMRMVKQQTIVAVYQGDSFGISVPDDTDWHAYVDDNEVNYEMTSASAGTVYNDAIVRVRKNDSNTPTLSSNGKVGMIIVEDGGTNQTINTEKLAAYANALKTSGKTGNVSVTGGTVRVTNFFTSANDVNNFGRADFAAKYSFGSVSGHKYQIYAYYYDGSTYHFNTTATTGTYR